PVLVDVDLSVDGERVNHRCSHSVKTSGHFVAGVFPAEFTSGVKHGHDGLKSRDFGLFMDVDRNTSSVVHHSHAVAGKKTDLDVVCMAAHGLVAGVVEDFVDE